MANPTLTIRQVFRTPEVGTDDRLTLEPGVNVLVGRPNTGKTKWFVMLDHLLGDDGKPEDKFEELFEKYDSVTAVCDIGGEEVTIERSWREKSDRNKAQVNGEQVSVEALQQLYLDRLGITPFRYPQGNPYTGRWMTLGWRGLVRHMYRRQSFWSDLADQQHEPEQHACLVQFLGLAQRLFSEGYSELVSKENQIRSLEFEREQFLNMLDAVSREIVSAPELGVAVTPQSIDEAIARLKSDIDAGKLRRQQAWEEALAGARTAGDADPGARDRVERLGDELATLRVRRDQLASSLRRVEERGSELSGQEVLLTDEIGRLERAKTATGLLPRLKITHCPACDQEISEPASESPTCFLCQRPVPIREGTDEDFKKRVAFEVEQLKAELKETEELLRDVHGHAARLSEELGATSRRIRQIEDDLRPIRTTVAALVPAEVTLLDVEYGRLQERLVQLDRIRTSLGRRERIAEQIQNVQTRAETLEREVRELRAQVDFQEASQLLEDGLNTFLNKIKLTNPGSWTQDAGIRVSIRDREFSIKVGRANWKTKLGGTQRLMFLMAYHYALMTLTNVEGCHYPGFAALDFPARLEDASSSLTKDQESFVIRPFVELFAAPNSATSQLIAASNSFEHMEGVHRIELTTVWKEPA